MLISYTVTVANPSSMIAVLFITNDTTHLNMGLSVSNLSNTVHSRTQSSWAWTKLYKGCARTFSTNFASDQSVGCSFAADTSTQYCSFWEQLLLPKVSVAYKENNSKEALLTTSVTVHPIKLFCKRFWWLLRTCCMEPISESAFPPKGLIHSWSEHSCLVLRLV